MRCSWARSVPGALAFMPKGSSEGLTYGGKHQERAKQVCRRRVGKEGCRTVAVIAPPLTTEIAPGRAALPAGR